MNIVSNDDATVAALFDRYSDYITTEKEGAREVYEVSSHAFPLDMRLSVFHQVSKLERPIGTIVTTSKEDEAVGEEPFQQTGGSEGTNTSLEALVTHEVVSKAWNLDIEVTSKLPKRLLKPSIFQGIGAQTNCQISLGPETGMLTVKGDNDREMDGALEYLGNLARAFVSTQSHPESSNETDCLRLFGATRLLFMNL